MTTPTANQNTVKHFVGWISLGMLKQGMHDIPVFRTADIAHRHTGDDTVHEVHVNLSGKTNISPSNATDQARGSRAGKERMKTKLMIAAAVVAIVSSALFADPPVPLAYSNEIKTIRFERITEYITATGNTDMICGYKTESTNWPSAIIHVVTYGRGTNAVFKLWTIELLPEPGKPWSNAEWKWYNAQTWITQP